MNREEWLKLFDQLPPAAQEYLLDPASGTNEDAAQANLAYDNDAWDRVMDVVWDLIFRKTSLPAFQEAVKKIAGGREPAEVEKELLLYVVLPLADLVTWDVEARLHELGASSKIMQSMPRISLRPVSYGAAVRRIASNAKISIFSEETVRKLRDILVSYLKGVRTEEQVLEILQRSQENGGLGLEQSQAARYMEALSDFISTTQVMSEEEYAKWYQEYIQQADQEPRSERSDSEAEGPSLETGSDAHDEAAPAARVRRTNNIPLEEAIDMALQQIGDLGKDEYMMKRLRNLISTRLRDVRNAQQVKDVLLRGDKVGGLELNPQDADRVAVIIENVYQSHRGNIEQYEREKIQRAMEEQKVKVQERKQRESEEHAKWYREKVQASGPDDLSNQLRAIMSGSKQAQAQPGSLSMKDVRSPVQLTGLSEELGSMTVDAFRRLSKDPKQAAKMVLQKLDTLQRESFESWTQGVQAWRQSPLQQQYLTLVADSFKEGVPVTELVEKKRRENPSLPSAEELGAVIQLNSEIHL